MKYDSREEGIFRVRKNRFVAEVELNGSVIDVHVPNTGRCREILVPGAKVLLTRAANPNRKYPYTLYAVYKGDMLVHIDSAGANRLAEEALNNKKIRGLESIRDIEREKSFSRSRFDFRFHDGERICYMEVKGVTLEENGIAMFPDAPTERGARHLEELIKAKEEGYGAYVLFVIQMKGPYRFVPHVARDPRFAENLRYAVSKGVTVLAYDCTVTPGEITLADPVEVDLLKEEETHA